jgi:hypothetical protein
VVKSDGQRNQSKELRGEVQEDKKKEKKKAEEFCGK